MLKHVLVAPLDWGLGHATRCIPVIKQLIKAGCTVTIAASGNALALLHQEFPGVATINLFGYNVRYSAKKRLLPVKILLQSPRILLTIYKEHAWLQNVVSQKGFDLVISDNRFGLYTNKIPCVFITHQLLIKGRFNWVERLVQKINYDFINNFSACWVPDFEAGATIAGNLSHPLKMPACPVTYIGPLSRFDTAPAKQVQKKYAWLAILSGPEPQRTILEEKLVALAPKLQGRILLVRGKPGSNEAIAAPANCQVINHLTTTQMQTAFAQSEMVVSRCGYTTVMEVLALQIKAVLIPTPGQTEQEYLAKRLFKQQWCYSCQQDDDLLYHFTQAKTFNYELPLLNASMLESAVLNTLKG